VLLGASVDWESLLLECTMKKPQAALLLVVKMMKRVPGLVQKLMG
jgi:hypothetical protein